MVIESLTPADLWEAGWEIKKDVETDYFRYSARFWVEDSGLFDSPEEAVEGLREALEGQYGV